MARSEDQAARGHRLIPLAAAGALALACALAFGRVFTGRAPTVRLAVAALLAVAVGWATERRGLVLATAASAVGLLVALTWLVFPQTAWYGLPSLRTLRAIERSLAFVGQQARTQVSPAPAFPPLAMAATVAVWAACSSAYTLLARAGSPMLALLPPVALVAFADLVLEDGVRPGYAGALLLGALAVVLADGLRRIRQWGPVSSGPTERRTARAVAVRGVRRVGALALAAGLLVPGLLPGFRSEPIVDLSGSGGGGAVRLDPFVSILSSLNRDRAIPLLRVTTTGGQAAYWRVLALDVFDGAAWTMSDRDLEEARLYPSPARLPSSIVGDLAHGDPLRQRFEVLTDLADRFLPMAYPPEVVDLGGASVRFDPELGLAEAPDPLEAGDAYTVLSRRVIPTPEELDAVRFGPPADYGRNTFLPADVPDEVLAIAREWTAGEPTPYRQILAIQRRLVSPEFVYSQDVRPVADARAIARFLTETKTGFCQQFSTAMAVLVRALGYPARVAVGYRPGDPDGNAFTVTTDDAHSWVEVLFPGYGWLPFEPTPGRSSPLGLPGSYLNPVAPVGGGGTSGTEGEQGETGGIGSLPSDLPPQIRNVEFLGGRRSGPVDLPTTAPSPSPTPTEPGYGLPLGLLALALLAAAAAALVLIPLTKTLRRALELRRRRSPRERVLAAYRVFDGEAADLGLGRGPGETVLEHRDRLARSARSLDGHLDALVAAAVRAAYAPEALAPEDAERAVRAARDAIRGLRRDAGALRALAGIYRPGW
jgi:transglutaminase-like putative cysteine protease